MQFNSRGASLPSKQKEKENSQRKRTCLIDSKGRPEKLKGPRVVISAPYGIELKSLQSSHEMLIHWTQPSEQEEVLVRPNDFVEFPYHLWSSPSLQKRDWAQCARMRQALRNATKGGMLPWAPAQAKATNNWESRDREGRSLWESTRLEP